MRHNNDARRQLIALVALLASLAPTFAWGWSGHELVGQIAASQLNAADQATLNSALEELPGRRPLDLVTVGPWFDLHDGGADHRHYINLAYTPEPTNEAFAAALIAARANDPVDVLTELAADRAKLADRATKSTDRALALAKFIHLVGDIHQPMHAVDRDKDAGGNRAYLNNLLCSPPAKRNLHSLWDYGPQIAYNDYGPTFQPSFEQMERPKLAGIIAYAGILQQTYGAAVQKQASLAFAPERWAQESWTVACQVAYSAPLDRGKMVVTNQYIAAVRAQCGLRVTLAGYRLAHELTAIAAELRS